MREHVFAIVAACVTFALLILGGVVHGTGSSLACPDWPTCYGEMFPKMEGGILYEHSHRMLGATVGLLTFVLALLLHKGRPRDRAVRIAGYAASVLVVFQGVLGGVTVILRLPTAVSTTHLATAMVFFCLLAWIAWRTRPEPSRQGDPRLRPWAGAALGLLYVQIVLGALVRHTGAGLGCTDIPLCHGELWPTGAHATAQVHMLHRLLGVTVACVIFAISAAVLRSEAARIASRRLALGAIGLVVVQVALGVLSVTTNLGLVPVTAHLGVGALLLVTVFLMFLSLPRTAELHLPGSVSPKEAAA